MGKYKEANEDLDLAVRYNYIPFESVNRLRGAIHSNMKKSDSLNDELSRVLIDKINSGNIEISDNLKYYTNGKEWGKNDKALSFSSSLLILCNEKATSGDDCTESPIDFKLDFVLHYGEIESYARFSDVKRKLLWVYEITNFYKTEEGYYILATLKNSDSETILLVNTVKNVILHQTVGDPEVSIFVIDK